MQGTMPGEEDHARPGWTTSRRGYWTGLPVEESIRMTEDIDKWRKYVHGVANPLVEDAKKLTEHNQPTTQVNSAWSSLRG